MSKVKHTLVISLACFCTAGIAHSAEPGQEYHANMSHDARILRLKPAEFQDLFKPDPRYVSKYDAEAQLKIYGGKYPVKTARPLLEIGRDLYTEGPYKEPITIRGTHLFGENNPMDDSFIMAYGDWRTAFAVNRNRGGFDDVQIATRANIDLDIKLTSTERIHAFFQPLQDDGQFTRLVLQSDDRSQEGTRLEAQIEPTTLFFEGDLAVMLSGWTGKYNRFDVPIAVGRMPFVLQNGVWAEDAFLGAAITPFMAKNSPRLNISNMDVTFFYGMDELSSPGLTGDEHEVYGVTTFIDALKGYIEAGYAYVDADLDDQAYHNATVSFTRRYWDRVSNSIRVIYNFGQDGVLDPDVGERERSADGWMILFENSLITHLPSTLVPYLNLFAGLESPQSLMRDGAAGGILKNTGLAFETDGLTGFPTLNASGRESLGGAIGVEYLFALDQQLVVEGAASIAHDNGEADDEYGLGLRYQRPLSNAWIFRTDAMVGFVESDELFGARMELRRKF